MTPLETLWPGSYKLFQGKPDPSAIIASRLLTLLCKIRLNVADDIPLKVTSPLLPSFYQLDIYGLTFFSSLPVIFILSISMHIHTSTCMYITLVASMCTVSSSSPIIAYLQLQLVCWLAIGPIVKAHQ